MASRIQLDDNIMENVNGGSIGFNPDKQGTYTMKCKYTGETYYGVPLGQAIEIAKYAATQTESLEGEQAIINWARDAGIIH